MQEGGRAAPAGVVERRPLRDPARGVRGGRGAGSERRAPGTRGDGARGANGPPAAPARGGRGRRRSVAPTARGGGGRAAPPPARATRAPDAAAGDRDGGADASTLLPSLLQVFTATAVKKDDAVEHGVKAAYKTGRVGVSASVAAGGALTAAATVADVAPGLAVSLTGTLPDAASAKVGETEMARVVGGERVARGAHPSHPLPSSPPPPFQLGLDYAVPHLTAKATIGLTSTPRVDLAATTAVKDVSFGASAAYDSAKGALASWSIGSSLTRADYQASALLENGDKVGRSQGGGSNPDPDPKT